MGGAQYPTIGGCWSAIAAFCAVTGTGPRYVKAGGATAWQLGLMAKGDRATAMGPLISLDLRFLLSAPDLGEVTLAELGLEEMLRTGEGCMAEAPTTG